MLISLGGCGAATWSTYHQLTPQQERFDLVVSLDKEAPPCALAQSLTAARRIGVGLSPHGTPIPLNPEAEHYVCLGLSDELKFHRNRKSYPRLVYEALGTLMHTDIHAVSIRALAPEE